MIFIVWHDHQGHRVQEIQDRQHAEEKVAELEARRQEDEFTGKPTGLGIDAVIEGTKLHWETVQVCQRVKLLR